MQHQLNEQQLAALDRHLHCAVLANAGSGKTVILVERFLRAALIDNVPVEQIVAITFTKAAAAEMRERVYARIAQLQSDHNQRASYLGMISDAELQRRLRIVSSSLASARISTFHSFCAGLVRQYADVLSLPYDVRDAEERESSYLCMRAVSSALEKALRPNSTDYPALLRCLEFVSISTIEDIVTKIAKDRSRLQYARKFLASDVNEHLASRNATSLDLQRVIVLDFLQTYERALTAIAGHNCYKKCLDECLLITAHIEKHGYDTHAKGLMASFRESFLTEKLLFNRRKVDKSAKENNAYPNVTKPPKVTGSIFTAGWNDTTEQTLLDVTTTILNLGVAAASEYSDVKRNNNIIDFDDMIGYAITLLEDEEILRSVRSNIRHLMIDEFQDTDPAQYQILQLLVPEHGDNNDVTPFVFLVGDDKQSIYQFRDADVRLFRRARTAIARLNKHQGDEGIRMLSKSFRMHPDLCTAVNMICSGFFRSAVEDEAGTFDYDVTYEDLLAGRTDVSDGSPRVHVIDIPKRSADVDDETTPASAEADLVARSVIHTVWSHQLRNRALSLKDIAILVPTHTAKQDMAEALRRCNIPFSIRGGRSFFSRPEIADVRNALLSCLDRSNNLATAAVMRSPILKCNDAEIIQASLCGRTSSIQDGLVLLIERGEATPRHIQAHTFFEHFSKQLNERHMFEVIEDMLSHTSWYTTIASEERCEQMIANIQKLIGICRDVIMKTGTSHIDVLEAISEPDVDHESESTITQSDDAVQIMTLHGAKGLEFDVVVIAGLSSKMQGDSYVETSELGLTLSLPGSLRSIDDAISTYTLNPSLSHLCNSWIARRRSDAENKRLLYVALTRAKEELIICLPAERLKDLPAGLAGMLTNGVVAYGNVTPLDLANTRVEDFTYHDPSRGHEIVIDRTAPVARLAVNSRTPSSTIDRTSFNHTTGDSLGSIIGSAIHAGIASVIATAHQLNDEMLMERIVQTLLGQGLTRNQAQTAAIEVFACCRSTLVSGVQHKLAHARIEQQLAAVIGDVLLHGMLDLRFPIENGLIEIWDWKTSAVDNAEDVQLQGARYSSQMQAYADLCLAAYPDCNTVRTRLVFTKAIQHDFHESYVVEYTRPCSG